MPISLDKLEEANRPLVERIAEFLARDPQNGYSEIEIFGNLEGFGNYAALYLLLDRQAGTRKIEPYKKALEELLTKGVVTRHSYNGVDYYAARNSSF
jgi:hypothetical protein